MSDDLELQQLSQFIGTGQYHRGWLNVNLTDGVAYVVNNGYSWFVSDAITVIKIDRKLQTQEFLAVKLKLLPENKAQMVITDGNDNVLYTQDYDYTDAKRELTLFFIDNVMLLDREY